MSQRIIRYGVAGLGRAGWDMHVHALRQRGDARVVAVADPEAERRQQAVETLQCRTYVSTEELFRDDDVEVVVLATPSIAHAAETSAALSAGKHVVVEKPMAMNVAEADAMIAAAKRAGRELFVHHNLRFTREFTHLDEVIRSRQLGELFHLRANYLRYLRRNDWQCLARNGGGLLNNAGSHILDLTLALLPTPVVDVCGDLRRICSAGDVEDHVKIFLRCADGCTADLEISTAVALDPPLPKWILCGSNGTLSSDGETSTLRWYDPKDAPPLEVRPGAAAQRRYGNSEVLSWKQETVPAVGRDVGTFYDNVAAVLNEGQAKWVTPQSVREVIRVIGLVRQSHQRAAEAQER